MTWMFLWTAETKSELFVHTDAVSFGKESLKTSAANLALGHHWIFQEVFDHVVGVALRTQP